MVHTDATGYPAARDWLFEELTEVEDAIFTKASHLAIGLEMLDVLGCLLLADAYPERDLLIAPVMRSHRTALYAIAHRAAADDLPFELWQAKQRARGRMPVAITELRLVAQLWLDVAEEEHYAEIDDGDRVTEALAPRHHDGGSVDHSDPEGSQL